MKTIITILLIGLISAIQAYSQPNPNFYLHANGVTCMCPNAAIGETGDVNGVTYTKRTAAQITPSNASTTCTSGISDMSGLFKNEGAFNGDISTWDVSSVNDMIQLFWYATSFNQDIGNWDVSSVTVMNGMFGYSPFDQDIGSWDVSNVINYDSMFEGVKLSTINYDNLLIGWSNLILQPGIYFDGGYSNYCNGEAARQSIISNYGWEFFDGGLDCTLGIVNNDFDRFIIYPSPTSGLLNIQSDKPISQIAIYNLLGQLVKSNTNQNTIDISSVDQGVYFVKVMDENGNIGSQKVVKK